MHISLFNLTAIQLDNSVYEYLNIDFFFSASMLYYFILSQIKNTITTEAGVFWSVFNTKSDCHTFPEKLLLLSANSQIHQEHTYVMVKDEIPEKILLLCNIYILSILYIKFILYIYTHTYIYTT